MSSAGDIVIGGGVAGLCAALNLLRMGRTVALIDPLPSPGGASFGNAGLISGNTVVPVALPGMLRNVPRWLRDPLGPLAVRPSYLPKAAPWLARWIASGRMARVNAISDAMRALHAPAFDDWRALLGDSLYRDLIRQTGQVQLWDGTEETPTARIERELRARHGIEAQPLGADDIRQIFPGIARDIARGVLVPGNGHTVSPSRLVQTLAELFRSEGGVIRHERALKLVPEAGGWMVMTNAANHRAGAVVLAAGAWSGRLLAPLDVHVPLETERGYHAMLPAPSLELRVPILHKSRGFGITQMEDGIRVAGTVEIAGLDAAPDERRAAILHTQARKLFPGLESDTPTLWMGHRPSTPDSLPVLGPVARHPGLFLCFGHSHFGMTGGPPSGRLVAHLVAGRPPPIDPAPYAPTRF